MVPNRKNVLPFGWWGGGGIGWWDMRINVKSRKRKRRKCERKSTTEDDKWKNKVQSNIYAEVGTNK
jgi:hypothetical protein